MKKVILLLVLVFSLNASEAMCKDAYSRYLKHSELFEFALERGDVHQMKVSNKMSIYYIEKTLAACGPNWKARKPALNIRRDTIKTSELLKKL